MQKIDSILKLSTALSMTATLLFSSACKSQQSSQDSASEKEVSEGKVAEEIVVKHEVPTALVSQTYYLKGDNLKKKDVTSEPEYYLFYYTASW